MNSIGSRISALVHHNPGQSLHGNKSLDKTQKWVRAAKIFTVIGGAFALVGAGAITFTATSPLIPGLVLGAALILSVVLTCRFFASYRHKQKQSPDESVDINRTLTQSLNTAASTTNSSRKRIPLSPIERSQSTLENATTREQRNADILESLLKTKTHPLTPEKTAELTKNIFESRRQINTQAIKILQEKLKADTEISPEVAQSVLDDWGLIGEDIKNDHTVLTENRMQLILTKAREETANRVGEHRAVLEELRKDLQNHAIPEDDSILAKMNKYQKLTDLQKNRRSLPEGEAERLAADFHTVINRFFLNNEIKRRKLSAFRHTPLETGVLKKLNYPDLDQHEKKIEDDALLNNLLMELLGDPQLSSKPVIELKKSIDDSLLEERLKKIGLSGRELQNVKWFIGISKNHMTTLKPRSEEWLSNQKQKIENDPAINDLRLIQLYLKKGVESLAANAPMKIWLEFVRDKRKDLKPLLANSNQDEIERFVESHYSPGKEKQLGKLLTLCEQHLKKEAKFHQKWGKKIVKESRQGLEDDHEILGKGVCWATSLKKGLAEQLYPDISVEYLLVGSITEGDRILQVWLENSHDDLAPKRWLEAHGLTKVNPIFSETGTDVALKAAEKIRQRQEKLKPANGVLYLGISEESSAHLLYLRVDTERNVYRLQDPNIGILEFSSLEETLECFTDMMKDFYLGQFTMVEGSYLT